MNSRASRDYARQSLMREALADYAVPSRRDLEDVWRRYDGNGNGLLSLAEIGEVVRRESRRPARSDASPRDRSSSDPGLADRAAAGTPSTTTRRRLRARTRSRTATAAVSSRGPSSSLSSARSRPPAERARPSVFAAPLKRGRRPHANAAKISQAGARLGARRVPSTRPKRGRGYTTRDRSRPADDRIVRAPRTIRVVAARAMVRVPRTDPRPRVVVDAAAFDDRGAGTTRASRRSLRRSPRRTTDVWTLRTSSRARRGWDSSSTRPFEPRGDPGVARRASRRRCPHIADATKSQPNQVLFAETRSTPAGRGARALRPHGRGRPRPRALRGVLRLHG